MINLRVKVNVNIELPPFVVKMPTTEINDPNCAILERKNGDYFHYNFNDCRFSISASMAEDLSGDILLVHPRRQIGHRLIRSNSIHNTLLITEQCDQLCLMCSQPPKSHHVDMLSYYYEALLIAPKNITIGFSGGEPMLHKEKLFQLIDKVARFRSDLKYHILTNGQHFDRADIHWLSRYKEIILWGVPMYSNMPKIHDEIVGKDGAFDILMKNLSILGISGSSVELRTVVLQQNIKQMPALSDFISNKLSFIAKWAIMQVEKIGFARRNWSAIFFDNSQDFAELYTAIDIMRIRNFCVALYNFPLCTVPEELRAYAAQSISDWKQKYLIACEGCTIKSNCCGFFEWYDQDSGFKEIAPR